MLMLACMRSLNVVVGFLIGRRGPGIDHLKGTECTEALQGYCTLNPVSQGQLAVCKPSRTASSPVFRSRVFLLPRPLRGHTKSRKRLWVGPLRQRVVARHVVETAVWLLTFSSTLFEELACASASPQNHPEIEVDREDAIRFSGVVVRESVGQAAMSHSCKTRHRAVCWP